MLTMCLLLLLVKGIFFVNIWGLLLSPKLKIKIHPFNLILASSWKKRLSVTISTVTRVFSLWTWWCQTKSSAAVAKQVLDIGR